jgi:basic membrane protein A
MMPGFIKTARFATCLGIAAGSIAAGRAADLSPAIVYDFGGKADRSFNQSAAEGVARFTKETGIACREFEISNQAQRTQIMRQFVRHGANIIAAIGFNQASAVEEVAKESPNVKFVIVDGVVDLPNVESITFKEQESSFLCGIAAALDSKTGKIGFVGGMDIPLILSLGRKVRQPPNRGF